ncbi:MAG: hypothetical protein UMU75_02015 [Halomonas sp.]|nr:hypothetical protein [Halomonas sp.]
MTHMPRDGFRIQPRHWYAWQMTPGYLSNSQSYYSPIYVTQVTTPSSRRNEVHLDFLNVLYLDGPQDFHLDGQVIHRNSTFLVMELWHACASLQRIAIVSHIGFGWLNQHCRHLVDRNPPALFGRAAEKHAGTYLDRAFPYAREKATVFSIR